MHSSLHHFVRASFLLANLAAAIPAQDTLVDLQRQLAAEARALSERGPTREQRDQLLQKHLVVVQKFVAERSKGDDRWNGRLMLADLHLQGGNREAAGKALAEIEPAEAPALVLLSAAAMAQHLSRKELRDRLVAAAVAKDAALADRLAMGRLLMTVLHEVARGERVFQDALAAATDDEQRALVRFHRADALRDREDLEDNAGFAELERLAKELPATYWGSVAKDRLRATELRPGDDAIPFRAKTRSGGEFVLAEQVGKAVVLAFWSAGDRDTQPLVHTLGELASLHGDKLAIVGVCLDRDASAIDLAIQKAGITFPVIGTGLGIETDVALRWFVEGPVVHVIDAKGKVGALGLHAGTNDARTELSDAVAKAISG